MVFFTTSSPVLMKPNFGISKNDIDTNNRTSKQIMEGPKALELLKNDNEDGLLINPYQP